MTHRKCTVAQTKQKDIIISKVAIFNNFLKKVIIGITLFART